MANLIETNLFPEYAYGATMEAWEKFSKAALDCTPTVGLTGEAKLKADLLRFQLAKAVQTMVETLEEMGEVITTEA